MFTITEAARRAGCEPEQLLARLIRDRFIYRYTGVGRPLAYVRWVRGGLFVNTATEVWVTPRVSSLSAARGRRPRSVYQ